MTPQANTWIIDSEASDHLCSDYFAFTEIAFLPQLIKIYMGDNRWVLATGRGTVQFHTSTLLNASISTVLYVPQLEANLLSVGRLIEKGYNVAFSAQSSVATQDSFEFLRAQYDNGIYKVNLNYGQPQPPTMQIRQVHTRQVHTAITKPLPMQTWHRRLGHLNEANVSRLATESADNIDIDPATSGYYGFDLHSMFARKAACEY